MKIERTFFRTKVARRVVTLFIICAVLPISALSVVSFSHVTRQLKEQNRKQLHRENKALAMSIYERLLLLRAEMRIVASHLAQYRQSIPVLPDGLTESLKEHFSGLALILESGSLVPLHRRIEKPPGLSESEAAHLQSGQALISHQTDPGSQLPLFMQVALDPEDMGRGILVGEINTSYLWEIAEGRPPLTELSVLDNSNRMLFSSFPDPGFFPLADFDERSQGHSGQFEWRKGGKAYSSNYRPLFLKPNFFSPGWVVVLTQSNEDALAPMRDFKKAFPFIVILSLGMVFLLSSNLIRRSMVPIEILRRATRKIAEGTFGHRVEIKTGDEFESLAGSFNEMSNKLKEGQALLVKAAKLSAMGQMGAGVLHEINQPLTAISGLLELSLLKKPSDDIKEYLKTAVDSVRRLNEILLRFKSFSHMSEGAIESLSINEIIDQVYKLLAHQLEMKRISCVIESRDDLPQILGDEQGLQQVFSNLLINAVHALENKEEVERMIKIKSRLSEGRVLVEIEDNGCGIPEEIQKNIFDPFFTTKSAEKGTGLGMAIVESILHKHDAQIDITSKEGVGTKFTLSFPVSTDREV